MKDKERESFGILLGNGKKVKLYLSDKSLRELKELKDRLHLSCIDENIRAIEKIKNKT